MKPIENKLDITEFKKSEIDEISDQLQSAEYLAEELNTVVNSLVEKESKFANFLTEAEQGKATALNNLNQVRGIINTINGLQHNIVTVDAQATKANKKIDKMSTRLSMVLEQLVFSAELIQKLHLQVQNRKALNQLVPDELVSVMVKSVSGANNAIALTLTAIKSTFVAVGDGQSVYNLSIEQQSQVKKLNHLLSGLYIDTAQEKTIAGQAQELVRKVKGYLPGMKDVEENFFYALEAAGNAEKNVKVVKTIVDNIEQVLSGNTELIEKCRPYVSMAANLTPSEFINALRDKLPEIKKEFTAAQQDMKAAFDTLDKVRRQLTQKQTALEDVIHKLDVVTEYQEEPGLINILQSAYTASEQKYTSALQAKNGVTKELEHAKTSLANANTRVASLTAGLAAAKAAALAA